MGYKLIGMDVVSEVKSRLNIEDVVSEYIQLKRSGRNFKGLSPWTNEKSPSFMVSPEKQIWHDFSSGKGGDAFSFVMEMEGLDFKGALELLARKAGVDLEEFRKSPARADTKYKSRAYDVLELSAKFYQKQLTANKAALSYLLKDRKFSKKTLLDWRIGYSPNTGRALSTFLTKNGFEAEEMKRAGLVFERSTGLGDMFRGRIMIPITDSRGSVVGFTARLLADEPDAPKYINTPQTIVYDKGRNVFGLHQAKEAIRKQGFVVVVEGNMDVISSHQANVINVVASAGTAMTEMHLRELKRFTGDIRLCFDADQAGITATERVIPLAQKAEVSLRIVDVKEAKDPDELIQKNPKTWKEVINQALYAPDWLIKQYKKQLDLDTAQGKRMFTDILIGTIKRLNDPVEQEHYLKEIAKLSDSSLEAVKAKLSASSDGYKTRYKKPKIQPGPIKHQEVEYQRLQDHLLAIALSQPKLRPLLNDCKEEFFNEDNSRKLFRFLKTHPDFKGDPKLAAQLQEIGDYVKIIVLQFEELYQDLPFEELKEQVEVLKRRLIERYVKLQKHLLAAQMKATTDDTDLHKLLTKANKLNDLIK